MDRVNRKDSLYAFTLVELLVAVSIIGILSATVSSTINNKAQRAKAEDSVRLSTLYKVAEVFETVRLTEGSYPQSLEGLDVATLTGDYLPKWPGDDYAYRSNTAEFSVYVPSVVNSLRCFKYFSCWNGVQECDCGDIEALDSCNNPKTLSSQPLVISPICNLSYIPPATPHPPTPEPPTPPDPPTPPNPTPSCVSKRPTMDAYVRSTLPTTSYGAEDVLGVDAFPWTKYAYLKFDLTDIANKEIMNATLRITVSDNTGAESSATQTVSVSANTNWNESVTYNTRPNVDDKVFAATLKGGVPGQTKAINITKAVSSYAGSSFTVFFEQSSLDGFDFYSREVFSSSPRLSVTYR